MAKFTQSIIFAPGDDGSLCHFGILGMKWGVRRYQNPDGTLTDEGRARYGRGSPEYKEDLIKQLYRHTDKAKIESTHPEIRDAVRNHHELMTTDINKKWHKNEEDGDEYLDSDFYRNLADVAISLLPERANPYDDYYGPFNGITAPEPMNIADFWAYQEMLYNVYTDLLEEQAKKGITYDGAWWNHD